MKTRLSEAETPEQIVEAVMSWVANRPTGRVEMSRERYRYLLSQAVKHAHEAGQKSATSGPALKRRTLVGLWRVWLVLSGVWALVVALFWLSEQGGTHSPPVTDLALAVAVPPVLVLIALVALFLSAQWVWRGFSGRS